MNLWLLYALVCVLVALLVVHWLVPRLMLSAAKHPSLAGHPRIARRLSRQIPHYEFGPGHFFVADGADADAASRRRRGFERLAGSFRRRSPSSIEAMSRLSDGVSDVRFIARYRVPFAFSRMVRESLASAVVVERSAGHEVIDLDGNRFIDLAGAYGVNVFGTDRYKRWIEQGRERVGALGPVLGPYHPVIEPCVEAIKRISGLEEVSFHMSGTEAVMQAVRLARYHTGRSHIVRFSGAYHGWWDDVQPGVGNPTRPGSVYTLAELSRQTLRVLRSRRDIACVLVNPLQALHPNANAPGDAALVSANRDAGLQRARYSAWLSELRAVCDATGIVLIFDEILVGFRIARGGAQEYFGVRADLVTYGKTLGGGLPVGVLCGKRDVMQRFRDDRPADFCFARGTFNSHPYVIGSMSAFLDWFDTEEARGLYRDLDDRWNARAARINEALEAAELPLALMNFSSVFTVLYRQPSRYNWMLQFYLNLEGLLLPWTGTGRLIFPIDFGDRAFDEVIDRFVAAGRAMRADGWWDVPPGLDNRVISGMMLREALMARLGLRV